MSGSMVTVCVLLVVLLAGLEAHRLDELRTVDDYLNICHDGQLSKSKPGPEASVFGLVSTPIAICISPSPAKLNGERESRRGHQRCVVCLAAAARPG